MTDRLKRFLEAEKLALASLKAQSAVLTRGLRKTGPANTPNDHTVFVLYQTVLTIQLLEAFIRRAEAFEAPPTP